MGTVTPGIAFVTFGMFIVDEIEWLSSSSNCSSSPPRPGLKDLIGGAGTYAVLGARLICSSPLSRSISWIVDIGSDFPTSIRSTIDSWDISCLYRTDLSRLTTRAWNGYGENEHRAFKYLTPKIRLEVSSLNDAQAMARAFHMVCSSARCIEITTSLDARRRQIRTRPCEEGKSNQSTSSLQADGQALESESHTGRRSPVIVWEPVPDLCTPAQLRELQLATLGCTVVSPNRDELRMFFAGGSSTPNSKATINDQDQTMMVMKLMGWHSEPTSAGIATKNHKDKDDDDDEGAGESDKEGKKGVDSNQQSSQSQNQTQTGGLCYPLIREGAEGCTLYIPRIASHRSVDSYNGSQTTAEDVKNAQTRVVITPIHFRAYHQTAESARVVDPTGGGNTFLGALAMALSGSLREGGSSSSPTTTMMIRDAFRAEEGRTSNQQSSQRRTRNRDVSMIEATIHAIVAAGFAIEQHGVPVLSEVESESRPEPESESEFEFVSVPHSDNSEQRQEPKEEPKRRPDQKSEYWNNETFQDRCRKYLSRERGYITDQLVQANLQYQEADG